MILHREFSASEVSQIADVSPANLQLWLKRDLLIGHKQVPEHEIEGGGSRGKHRRFRWYSVMEAALAGVLISHGFPPAKAFPAVGMFAHASDGGSHWTGEAPGPLRLPGLPFHHKHGPTYLYIAGDQSFTVCRSVPEFSEERARNILGNALAYTVIDTSELFNHMSARLGIRPYGALDEIYGERVGPAQAEQGDD